MTIKIVSDGTAGKTYVYDEDGKPIGGHLTKIEIEPIEGGKAVVAKLTFYKPEIEIVADGRALIHGLKIDEERPDV